MNKWGERKREKEKRKQPMLVATRPRMVGGIIIVLSTLGSVVIGMPLSIISSMSCPQQATTDKRKKEKIKREKKRRILESQDSAVSISLCMSVCASLRCRHKAKEDTTNVMRH